jgi:GNAT superfamily N-acetyltransferase
MSDILLDGSPDSLVAAMEANLPAFLPMLGRLGEYHEDKPPGVKRSITGIAYALLNSIMDAQLTPGNVAAAIDAVTSDARGRNVPLLWWIGPSSRPADLISHLEAHGFARDDEVPGMAADLDELNENLSVAEGVSFRLAEEHADQQDWCRTMAAGFEVPASATYVVDSWIELLSAADRATTLPYLAYLDGRPVATCLLFLAAGVAGIYSVATIPEARRKGIGAYVTLQPLLQARAMGYRFGILQASQMGLPVYRSLGFREYCTISIYRWRPVEPSPA